VGPRDTLDDLEKDKTLAPTKNSKPQTFVLWPSIPTELSKLHTGSKQRHKTGIKKEVQACFLNNFEITCCPRQAYTGLHF
jgi:hypothetical protein